jgi:RNA polymerase sigma-70 factor, ECF subfamily
MMPDMAVVCDMSPAAGTPAFLDRERFGQDLLAHRESVFCLCLGFARNRNDAWDLAQETFARALRHAGEAPVRFLKAWLLRIARNVCIDRTRRDRYRRTEPLADTVIAAGHSPETHTANQEAIARVRAAIARLSPRLRDVLVLREYGELSYEEIAHTLAVSPGTVMSRLSRARQAVLAFYQEELHDDPH